MKILFLCGSLAPGRDGVGDYTRRLACELIRQGHNAAIIAINDTHLQAIENSTQSTDGTEVQVLRLPANMKAKQKFAQSELFIDSFNPEWMSLQYVPFSFQKKGLPFGLASHLARIGKGRKWHVLLHELWLGSRAVDSLKHIFWGFFQRYILLNLLKNIKPELINTQTPVYQMLLEKHEVKAELLPLFSNIPFISVSDKLNFNDKFQKNKIITVIVFGTLYPCFMIEQLMFEIKQFEQKYSQKIAIKAIGRNGNEINKWIDSAAKFGISFHVLGEQPHQIIANEIQLATIGLSTTPLVAIQKSGAVAAMRECGLPVISLENSVRLRGINNPPVPEGIFPLKEDIIQKCLLFKPNSNQFPGLKVVTKMFSDNLNNINYHY